MTASAGRLLKALVRKRGNAEGMAMDFAPNRNMRRRQAQNKARAAREAVKNR